MNVKIQRLDSQKISLRRKQFLSFNTHEKESLIRTEAQFETCFSLICDSVVNSYTQTLDGNRLLYYSGPLVIRFYGLSTQSLHILPCGATVTISFLQIT